MSLKGKVCLFISIAIMVAYSFIKIFLLTGIIYYAIWINHLENVLFVAFCFPFYIFVREFMRAKEEVYQKTLDQLRYKNTYLEHAARILRHDMHSGINVYIPRGISSLERRIPVEIIEKYKLEAPLRLLKEGLIHTQKVYRGVFEFTNLVKQGESLNFEDYNLRKILYAYLETTSYKDQVVIDKLTYARINEPLFCTAIDNLIRNGLKYNDNENKLVSIYMESEDTMVVQDNGRGMTQEEFLYYAKNNTRKSDQKENGSGLGLGICLAILQEHKFSVTCEKQEVGTKIKIKIK